MMTLFLVLAALVTVARLGGAVAQRLGQPTVLGELIVGILLGPSALGLVHPEDPSLHLLSEFGVVILLFQIGLHTDLRQLIKVGGAASAVAGVGVVVPFGLGFLAAELFGLALLPALVCGAALTATSVGISARILGDLGELDSVEGRTVLGAAVLDDVIGLVILAVVAGMVNGGDVSTGGIARTVALAIGFLVIAIALGRFVVPKIFAAIHTVPVPGTTGAIAVAFALALAAIAEKSGSAPIIGAFAAGLVLYETPQRQVIEEASAALGHFFVPVFFVSVGASVDLSAMRDPAALGIGGALLAIGIVGKFVAGYAPFWLPMRRAMVGVAMIPRGEVGLIFAQMGLATGALTPALFGALMMMVIGTTIITPIWLSYLVRGGSGRSGPRADLGSLDDLVSGER
ncbi:MAG: cation:proton antiporter [Gemmatimonadales bacterium]